VSCYAPAGRVRSPTLQKTLRQMCSNDNIQKVIVHVPLVEEDKLMQEDKDGADKGAEKGAERQGTERQGQKQGQEQGTQNNNHTCALGLDKIVLHRGASFGDFTKVLPLLDMEDMNGSRDFGVILFDETKSYPPEWFEDLMSAFDRHNGKCAVGKHGSLHKYLPFRYDKFNWEVDDEPFLSMNTEFGAIYPASALPPSCEAALAFQEKYKNHEPQSLDLVLASWCYKTKTKMYLTPISEEILETWVELNGDIVKTTTGKENMQLGTAMMFEGDFPVPWADVGTIAGSVVLVVTLFIFLMIMLRLS